MFLNRIRFTVILLFFGVPICAQNPNRPFPQHVHYAKGSIKPNHISQAKLDQLTLGFYEQWKKRYIKSGCHPGEYYVWFECKGNKQCVSEGQGYGMTIIALMAGADPSA